MKTRILIALCLILTFGVAHIAAQARQPGAPAAPLVNKNIYLPLVAKPVTIDLTITQLDVSQAIQTPTQTVPFVSNRPTIARAYLQTIGDHALTGVYVSFSAKRLGAHLAGSPLLFGPVTAPLATSQGNYASTVNISLPSAWLSGNVTLTVTADPAGAIKEFSEANNQRSTLLAFNDVPPLDIKIVPIHYHDTRTGIDYPAVSTDPVSDFVRRLYPLSAIYVTYHSSPIYFAGDLSQLNDWSQLLDLVSDIKYTENMAGASLSKVYYGLLPPNYYPPYYAGIGWLGYRAALGAGSSTTVGAHEIGHNFGREHAPCGGPAYPDQAYPYPNASIGYYGIDVYGNYLVSPGNPDYAKDLMSYCGPPWISDYTYVGLYNDQRINGLVAARMAPAQPVLLVRARFDGPQAAELLPIYFLDGFPDEVVIDSDYAIQLIDQEGVVIAAYPVRRYKTADLDPPAYAIYAALAQPAQPIAKIRLVHAGELLAERLMSDRLPQRVPMQAPKIVDNAITLAWGDADSPALMRYTSGSDEQWTTLGVDILGGRLAIDHTWLSEGALHFEVIPADASTPVHYTLDVPAGRN